MSRTRAKRARIGGDDNGPGYPFLVFTLLGCFTWALTFMVLSVCAITLTITLYGEQKQIRVDNAIVASYNASEEQQSHE